MFDRILRLSLVVYFYMIHYHDMKYIIQIPRIHETPTYANTIYIIMIIMEQS